MKRPRPKYQVFISSTFDDLRDERNAVIFEVLRLGQIPVGMEGFTATDDRGWKTILPLIDTTDYYVLILAGRYGSVDSTTKKSWTQMEYEYALEKGIPVLAFVRSPEDTKATQLDLDPKPSVAREKQKKLKAFISQVRSKHQAAQWRQKDDLAIQVGAALSNHILRDEATDASRPGWFRGNDLPSSGPEVAEQIARLSSQNEKLRQENETLRQINTTAAQPDEIGKATSYLDQLKTKDGTSYLNLLARVANYLATGIDRSDFRRVLFPERRQLRPNREDMEIAQHFLIARVMRLEKTRERDGSFPEVYSFFLTDLGAAIALDVRIQQGTRQPTGDGNA